MENSQHDYRIVKLYMNFHIDLSNFTRIVKMYLNIHIDSLNVTRKTNLYMIFHIHYKVYEKPPIPLVLVL
ncbi:hypothetical protein DQG23_03125 [Paenibacillus contaminans]|uniref:Uncharacterized protein n=1 Tax=Paenibacillus contaminans TaxID=450362 RepID=A0A329MUE6_9BACL|nr:hypothetical protein DQG23_03125 [Paenibacillus contaminans]